MNYAISVYTRLIAATCISIYALPIYTMQQQQTAEEKRIQKLVQESEDKGIIKGYFSSRRNLDKFIVGDNDPANPMWKKGAVDLIRRMTEFEGQSGTRLYEIHYSWQTEAKTNQQNQSPQRTMRKYVARFQDSFWTPDINSKKSEIAHMMVAGCQVLCPQVNYADPHTNGGFIIMDYVDNIGTAQDVNWQSEQTYTSLGKFLRKLHNTGVVKPHRNPNKSFYNILAQDEANKKSYISRIVDKLTLQKDHGSNQSSQQAAAQFLETHLPPILAKLKAIDEAIPPCTHRTLVHGDLHTRNLKPKKYATTNQIEYWCAFDWDHTWFTQKFYDAAFVETTWVPEAMRQVFWKAFWGDKQPTPQEEAQINVMRVVASTLFGIAYGASCPSYLAAHFSEQRHLPGGDTIAQEFMHKSFDPATLEECGKLGLALLTYGLQKTDDPKFFTYLAALQKLNETTK